MRADNDVLGPPCHQSSDKETKRRKMGGGGGGGGGRKWWVCFRFESFQLALKYCESE